MHLEKKDFKTLIVNMSVGPSFDDSIIMNGLNGFTANKNIKTALSNNRWQTNILQ